MHQNHSRCPLEQTLAEPHAVLCRQRQTTWNRSTQLNIRHSHQIIRKPSNLGTVITIASLIYTLNGKKKSNSVFLQSFTDLSLTPLAVRSFCSLTPRKRCQFYLLLWSSLLGAKEAKSLQPSHTWRRVVQHTCTWAVSAFCRGYLTQLKLLLSQTMVVQSCIPLTI